MESPLTSDKSGALFEIKLELSDGGLIFSPTLSDELGDTFLNLILSIIQDVSSVTFLIPKVSTTQCKETDVSLNHGEELPERFQLFSFSVNKNVISKNWSIQIGDVKEHPDILALRNDIIDNVRCTARRATEYLKRFQSYDYIWLVDRDAHLQALLQDTENDETDDDENSDRLPNNLNLQTFRTQVSRISFPLNRCISMYAFRYSD